ncbi:MAG: uroporphyrinogen-III C-methyltransferase [Rhodospirillaceae bacterium]|jgi:uroporphyrin-III C-methyltransferase|nr:uroporphyrinogen-III C-methyltransferase [Rhodospirillaceae bacterium]MBT4490542.1 uroporphyrinogen-III C-methyltransferase [Rhodospirillaceae bacterium]MBT5894617.1 uroporphyrinogen-III C-methyltransferase [Rhodospirillaceae bacterium]MBT6430092.1 uroporphyrinogen-III C-methyltransferase [Rhodospirillaceae bacterium]MBT7755908.1 uroporphyrinogen-III C-methyltransferase [Rhodospirillaceae bacterium]
MPTFEPGTVWLAGAGPGDPGLLTLHAVNAIRQADVIIYDALVSRQILDALEAPERLEYAGKRGGKPSPQQRDISLRLIELARQDKRVLRLKGGDPFVFGRGGEEALALARENVPFRIIPGITAGVGGLAYAGIPATHRAVNTVVSFITGHTITGRHDGIDWIALSQGSPVLVFYMGLKQLPTIQDQLVTAGRPRDQAMALISKAATPAQHVVITTIGSCVEAAETSGIEAPVLIAVGDVVDLHASLDWFDAGELGEKAPFKHD